MLMLGAFAIALAQYDARNRTSATSAPITSEPRKAIPIAVSDENSPLIAEAGLIGPNAVIRGNDEQSGMHAATFSMTDDDNPLRTPPQPVDSHVVLASDNQPIPSTSTPRTSLPSLPNTTNLHNTNGPDKTVPSALPRNTATWPSGAMAGSVGNLPQTPRELPTLGAKSPVSAPSVLPQKPTGGGLVPAMPLLESTPNAGSLSQATTSTGQATLAQPNIPQLPTTQLPTTQLPRTMSPNASSSTLSDKPTSLNSHSLSDMPQPGGPATNMANPSIAQAANQSAIPIGEKQQAVTQAGTPASLVSPMSSPQNSLLAAPQPLGSNSTTMQTYAGSSTYTGQVTSPQRPVTSANEPRPNTALTSSQSRSSSASVASLVSNEPGSRFLDGPQNGSMLIQKRIPEEIQVGRKAPVVITVRNEGSATAHEVMVVDRIPRGAEFVDAHPPVSPTAEGVLIWQLGEMVAGDERTINLQIIPRAEGDIGSTFSVYSAVQGSVRTVATLPKLEITHSANAESLIGAQQEIKVSIRNIGTGIARNVRMEADLPKNLRHSSGEQHLETMLDQLHPNQSVTVPLTCIAAEPGTAQANIRAVIDETVESQHLIEMQVVAPSLQVSIEGPKVRFLERPAAYRLHIHNAGTAPATHGDFVLRLPSGLKYIEASDFGEYDPSQHAVFWRLDSVPPGKTATTDVKLLPVETGPQMLTFQAAADLGIQAEAKGQLVVQGQAELAFTIEEDNDPIETGSTTTYSVTVSNLGSRPDQNIQLLVQIPAAGKVVRIDPALKYDVSGAMLRFEPIPQMESRDQRIFRFEVQYNAPGTHVVRAQLTSQNWSVPVTKEEGTHVYNDRD